MIRATVTGLAVLFGAVFGYRQNWPALVLVIILWFAFFSLVGASIRQSEYEQRIAVLEGLVDETAREQGH
jgi:hypothetical protein